MKFLKIAALVTALLLIVFVADFANSLMGNPVSKYLAQRSVSAYLAEKHPDTDYVIERISYSFKDGSYRGYIVSPSSPDSSFTVVTDMLGRYRHDTYDNVASKWNTAARLEDSYRALADTVFESPGYPYSSDIAFADLEIHSRAAIEDPNAYEVPAYALVRDDLVPDKVYDIRALGEAAGHLIVYVDGEELTAARAAEILLDLRARMDEAGVPFRAIDLHLQHPLPEEGPRPDGGIDLTHFLYEDITPDGLIDRVIAADAAYQANDVEK